MSKRNRHKYRFKDNPNNYKGNTIGNMFSKNQITKLKNKLDQDGKEKNTKTNKSTT